MPTPTDPRNQRIAAKLLGGFTDQELAAGALLPKEVGAYRILGALGRGGSGLVLDAEDCQGTRVAIKLLTDGKFASPAARRRIEREARALASIQHPNVARIRHVGTHDDATFLVLDHYVGGSLRSLLKLRIPLPPRRVAEFGAQLADGLAAAHAQGVLHRDVKPENVLLDHAGVPVLCDFGLVKTLSAHDESLALTQSGQAMGTPGYLAPEQARAEEAGPPADVYGLGATLYDMLTGRPPVVGTNVLEVIWATGREAPPPIRSLRDDVPPQLEAIVLRCLHSDPAQRWASASALSAALRQFLDAPPRTRLSKVVFAVAGLSVLCAGAVFMWPRDTDPAPPSSESSATLSGGQPSEPSNPLLRYAEAGDTLAQFELGEQARAEREFELAYSWTLRAAEGGHPRAMTLTAKALLEGLGTPRDPHAALEWFVRGAESGDVNAAYNAGALLTRGGAIEIDLTRGAGFFRQAAEGNHLEGMSNWGWALAIGQGVAPDPARGVLYCKRAAERGLPSAMTNLGHLLAIGSGVDRNRREAAQWFRRAADAGDLTAMHNLGSAYGAGAGVDRDEAQAVSWFRRAARAGNPASMYVLGVILSSDRRSPTDRTEGRAWLKRAAQAGYTQETHERAKRTH